MAAERRRPTVRAQATLAAVVVVGVVLVAGAVALLAVLRDALTAEVRASAQLRATELAAELNSGRTPVPTDAEGELVQLLDGSGTVVAASPVLAGSGPLARLSPGQSAEITAATDDGRFLVVAAAADGQRVVLVARTMDDVTEPTDAVLVSLVIGLPVLLAVVGATTWLTVGRALAPVDAIRREVEEISADQLHRRVPDPAARDEIARLARTMNRMLDRLEQAQQRQRRFISDASHELRSPVATIRQHAEVALAHPDATGVTDLAATVLAENLRVQRLVEDLLLLAKADEDTLLVTPRPVDLDDLVFAEAQRLREMTSLRIDTTAVSGGRVFGDHTGLARALRNLGDNAARHARERIAFTLASDDGEVLLTVADDGSGIPAADRDRVLHRFVRLDAARARDSGGSGLGLAIVDELVRAHRGTVTVGASPLGGALIKIRLPEG